MHPDLEKMIVLQTHDVESKRLRDEMVALPKHVAALETKAKATEGQRAVIADLIDLAQGRRLPSFAEAPEDGLSAVSIAEHAGPCYVRLMVLDQPGVIADVAAELRNERVSMEAMIQRRNHPGSAVPVVLTTHPSQEAALRRALGRIGQLGTVLEPPRMIRIES